MTLAVHHYGNPDHPAIIFLHGAGISSWMWLEHINQLKNEFHCITVDLPGNGDSADIEWVSFPATANQLAEIIRTQTRTGTAHVVGLSLGGYVALFLLQQHPNVIESLMVSGVSTRPFPRQWLYRPLLLLLSVISKWDVIIQLNVKMMQLPEDVLPLFRQDSKRFSRQMLRRVYATLLNYTLPTLAPAQARRLLALAGDNEAALIKNTLVDFPAKVPNAVIRLVPNAHHGWNGEHPELFTAVLRAWAKCEPLPTGLVPVV